MHSRIGYSRRHPCPWSLVTQLPVPVTWQGLDSFLLWPFPLVKVRAVFLWDSGSSVGEITGHNKVINSVDIKQSRRTAW